MRKPQGYAVISDDKGNKEWDTMTCNHCNKVTFMKAGHLVADNLGGFCRVCMKNICGPCVGQSCIPFERVLEMQERSYKFRSLI